MCCYLLEAEELNADNKSCFTVPPNLVNECFEFVGKFTMYLILMFLSTVNIVFPKLQNVHAQF